MFLSLFASAVSAQERDKVAIFVVADPAAEAERVDAVLEPLRTHLAAEGKHTVTPEVTQTVSGYDLSTARRVGRLAYNELAEGKPPATVLEDYGATIREALQHVSAVRDAEGRSILWNLCGLQVQLLLLSGLESDADMRQAVLDCSRRFVERPPLGKAWLQEVVRAFQRFTTETAPVQVSVGTAPAGCELRVYGASVGVTPTVIELIPGSYEMQMECAGREGRVHRIDVTEPRDLVMRMSADEALSSRSGVSWLSYESSAGSMRAVQDASALALEAGAESFVLLTPGRGNAEVEWLRPPANLLGAGSVPVTASERSRAEHIAAVFDPRERNQDKGPAAPKRHRVWADYALGGGLVAVGSALSVFPLLARARHGQCADSDCRTIYDGRDWKAGLTLAAAGALVGSGIAVVWAAPFGKRYSVTAGTGLSVRGSF